MLTIELALTILRINESLTLMNKEESNCLLTDPWRYDYSNLRKNAVTCKLQKNLQISNNFQINELLQEKIAAFINKLPVDH